MISGYGGKHNLCEYLILYEIISFVYMSCLYGVVISCMVETSLGARVVYLYMFVKVISNSYLHI